MTGRKPLVLGAGGAQELAATDALAINALWIAGFEYRSAAFGLTASGTTQATALALTKQANVVASAALLSGVILPLATSVSGYGVEILVINRTGVSVYVYPPVNAAIDSGAVNASTTIGSNSAKRFLQITDTQYFTA